jgi:hypothetical protein
MVKRTTGWDGPYGDRYRYDFKLCTDALGWAQLDTRQDAPYYGTWINPTSFKIMSYCEGDTSLIECDTEQEFIEQLRICIAWHTEREYFIGIDALGAVREALVRLGFAEHLP